MQWLPQTKHISKDKYWTILEKILRNIKVPAGPNYFWRYFNPLRNRALFYIRRKSDYVQSNLRVQCISFKILKSLGGICEIDLSVYHPSLSQPMPTEVKSSDGVLYTKRILNMLAPCNSYWFYCEYRLSLLFQSIYFVDLETWMICVVVSSFRTVYKNIKYQDYNPQPIVDKNIIRWTRIKIQIFRRVSTYLNNN